jgi:tetratricopeptide (TPR) repeat protein
MRPQIVIWCSAFALCARRIYLRAVSDLLAGLLGALLATNAPQGVSNLVVERAGFSFPLASTNDPVENKFYRILLDHDAAEKEIQDSMDNADASAKEGANGRSSTSLHLEIQRRLDGVKKEYQDFVEQHPNHLNVRLAFGSFLNDSHDEEGACAQWETARQLAPSNSAAWNNLANYYGHRGPVKKAFEYYDKAIELSPAEPVYFQNLAATVFLFRSDARDYYHLNEQQVFDKSLNLYRQAIKLDPDNFALFTDYAKTFYGLHPPRWKDGLAAWTEALQVAHDDDEREEVSIHLARIHLKLGDYDEARANLAVVTNAGNAALKTRLTRNLNAALEKARSNAPSAAPAGK